MSEKCIEINIFFIQLLLATEIIIDFVDAEFTF